MKKVILSILLLVVLFTTYASATKRSDCALDCLSQITGTESRAQTRALVAKCLKTCVVNTASNNNNGGAKVADLRKKLSQLSSKIDHVAQELLNKDVQKEVAVLSEYLATVSSDADASAEVEALADASASASVANGDTLQATTGLNIRSGPCTSHGIVGGLSAGQTTKFTGQTASGCGYTWYSVSGGWVASNFVKVIGSSGPKNGDTLTATDGLNIRSGPCTTHSIVGGLSAGQSTKFTGQTASGCGYTWYSVPNGWVASNFVKVGGGGGGGGGGCRTRNYPLFKQCDSRWGSHALGGGATVCGIGCLMSSVSMALNGLGKNINGQSPNPGTLNAFLRANGGYVQGGLFVWGSVARYGLKYIGQPTNKAEIKNHVCANNVVILNVNNGGHWVLATGASADGQTFYVNDPGANRSSFAAWEVVRAGIFTL